MTEKIDWVEEIKNKHSVENEPLLETQLELFEKDIRQDERNKIISIITDDLKIECNASVKYVLESLVKEIEKKTGSYDN